MTDDEDFGARNGNSICFVSHETNWTHSSRKTNIAIKPEYNCLSYEKIVLLKKMRKKKQ